MDHTKHILGKLCRHGHAAETGSDQSWRYLKKDGSPGPCVLCQQHANAKTPADPAKRREYEQRYRNSEKGRTRIKARRQHPDVKAKEQAQYKAWAATPAGQAARAQSTARYRTSDKAKQTTRTYRDEHREMFRQYQRDFGKKVRAERPETHARWLLRTAFHNRMAQLSAGKMKSSAEYGVDYAAILEHIGPRPSPEHHVDHIVPCSYFSHDDEDQIRICWHPLNMRWLIREVNWKKNATLPDTWPVGLPFIRGTGSAARKDPVGLARLEASTP